MGGVSRGPGARWPRAASGKASARPDGVRWPATMRLILLWGLGLGLVTVVIDVIAGEAARNVNDTDLAAAINLVDQLIGFVLYGWVGYRVARIVRELRQGLEAAVLAGVIAGTL